MIDREFLTWDGEGIDDRFTLLANSNGDKVEARSGLSTGECFDFLLKAGSDPKGERANVWFSFVYDVNMMLRDVPWSNLHELRHKKKTHWNGYVIDYFPRKIFSIRKGGKSFRSADTFSFFTTSFLRALEEWGVDIPPIIEEGKAARSDFSKWTNDQMSAYNHEECVALVELMNRLRKAIKEAGWNLSGWYGPGALANWFLKSMRAHDHIAPVPAVVDHAYFGGRIDAEGWGTIDGAYHYDITSAYPWAMTMCRSLVGLEWKPSREITDDSLVHVKWKTRGGESWNPFPWRAKDGSILYPPEGEGWYWGVEVLAAQRRLGSRLKMTVPHIITPRGAREYPLQRKIEEAFRHRRLLKKAHNPAHNAIKLGLNSLYGKTAQKVGSRTFYTLAWAGFLTAATRAKVSDAMIETDTISTMTDGIYSRTPFTKLDDEVLGGWTGEKVERISIIEPGVYEVDEMVFTRGHEASAIPPIEVVLDYFRSGVYEVKFEVQRFVGFALALMGGEWVEQWRHFVTFERTINSPEMFGTSKRMPGMFTTRKPSRWNHIPPLMLFDGVSMSNPYSLAEIVPPTDYDLADDGEEEDD